ncbi:MAG: hypothetical protein HWE39_24250 [Oceanospirillaceae bacterium]|nr:hypothetical protein [Oceanospirillaceae bacterium]
MIQSIEILKLIGIIASASTLITGATVYLGKKLFEQYLNKDFEKFKIQLEQQNENSKLKLEKQLESYRADLNLLNSQQSQLYTKKAEVIEQLYQLMVELHMAMLELTRTFKNVSGMTEDEIKNQRDEEIRSAAQAHNKFFQFYRTKKIYLDKKACELIDKIKQQTSDAFTEATFRERFQTSPDKYTFNLAKEAREKVEKDINALLETLEDEFRLIIGNK